MKLRRDLKHLEAYYQIYMKVSIGSKIVEGPWGGGNLFVKNLSNYLLNLGHEVIYDLSEPDVDLILLTDPRSRSESSSTFNHIEINLYKKHINPNVAVVQRINECDERKNTNNINNFYLDASECADKVVFVSNWLKNIYTTLGMEIDKTTVIMSGSNRKVFKNYNNKLNNNKVNIVTHHWSSHKNKGFESYELLDKLLLDPHWKNVLHFTYIGNTSDEYLLKNSTLIEPISGTNLGKKLSENDIYLTGSINEPSGNHHIEAALCGLPILYLNSGGIPEYCEGFGVSYNNLDEFEDKLKIIISEKEKYINNLKSYQFDSENMNKEYLELFESLVLEKKESSKNLKTFKKVFYLLRFKFRKLTRNFSQVNLRIRIKKLLKI